MTYSFVKFITATWNSIHISELQTLNYGMTCWLQKSYIHHTISFYCKIWVSYSGPVVNSVLFNAFRHYVVQWVVFSILKYLSVFIFRIKQYKKQDFSWTAGPLKKKVIRYFDTVGATHLTHHIPEDFSSFDLILFC